MLRQCLVALSLLSLSAAAVLAGEGDAKLGMGVFKKCASCHSATEPVNRVGPSLMAVVGRPVASLEGYSYSPAMKTFAQGGKMWDEALLRQFLPGPQFLVRGTRMAFPGLKNETDLDNLIAYLKNPAAAQ